MPKETIDAIIAGLVHIKTVAELENVGDELARLCFDIGLPKNADERCIMEMLRVLALHLRTKKDKENVNSRF